MKFKLSPYGTGALMAVTGIVMFSAKAIMVKLGYRFDADALTMLLLRMVFSLPFYIVISARQLKKHKDTPLQKKDWQALFWLGLVGYYLASYFDFYGLQFISASLERLILFIYPTLVVLITAVVYKKKPAKIQVVAIIVTYAGVFLSFADDLHLDGNNLLIGSASIFMSAFTYAIYLVGSGSLIPRIGPVRFTAYGMTISCLIVIIHYAVSKTQNVFHQPAEVYFLGFAMAVFSTVIPSFLISEGIKRIGASDFAIYGSLGPVSTIGLALIFLDERIDIYQIIGTLIVIAGVTLINIKKADPAKEMSQG
ncbi:MAG: DMT family transporter [Cyclobacteriaceae bacterium]|nr:DMT family transporter [Cyclobacteriaceae bacterium]